MKQYIVDAFTDEPFSGNPAAVCVMDKWMTDEDMMKLARENNLSETAFIVKEEEVYHLRWFTPGTEVDLCGHATLASAYVILEHYEKTDRVEFITRSGRLTVARQDGLYEMDFPVYDYEEIPVTDDMEKAYGVRPARALLGTDLVCVFDKEEQVRGMKPDQALLSELDGRIQNATAAGSEADCVSRSFAPKLAIAEDPVCGSAHCQIANFWSAELGKKKIHAYQASERGGHLFCEIGEEGRMTISGNVCLVTLSEVVAFD
ncbi:MAG: PhzF family phenazine biosynthesis protein [Firmicutes bacterium]|nr:PhzF family phenazine biosynthesis protein [Bacillota bacterium]